jgi:putative endonuclease
MNTKEIGDFGERAAEEYLEEKDYEILERNFRLKFGEIDIIAENDACIVFVEVKTRKSNLFGEPSEYVNRNKRMRVKKAAACYMDVVNNNVRFDVIEVFYEESGGELFVTKINHIENAF